MKTRNRCLAAIAAGLTTAALSAQAPPLGAEFQINSYTTGAQDSSSAASRRDGSFVIVWRSSGQDGDLGGVFGQRFGPTGLKVGGEFPVNSSTTGDQNSPAIGVDGFGNFVVAFDTDGVGGFDDHAAIQRFTSSGAPVGAPFDADSGGTSNISQVTPVLAMRKSGDFVVAFDVAGTDFDVDAQRFDATGAKVGSEFRVNTYTTSSQGVSGIAMNESGEFVVTWISFYQLGEGTDSFAQKFDATGAKVTGEIPVNSYINGNQGDASVAISDKGDFVVVWDSQGQDGSGYGVFGQRFNASAQKIGDEFRVNTYTTGDQGLSSIAMDRSGNFLVVWQSLDQDGSSQGVFGQLFEHDGTRIGSEFRANVTTASPQQRPRVVYDGTGYLIVWNSDNQDGSSSGVFARRQILQGVGLSVDVHGIGTSNLNGVLEPGESVVVEPEWASNLPDSVALDGSVSSFAGPPGPIYAILDSTASYGSMPSQSVATCADGSPNACYAMSVSGARPALHWDATLREDLSTSGSQFWKLHVGGSFTDVPTSQLFYKKIETLLHNEITLGCGGSQYCPDLSVQRDQMAIFVAKAIAGSGELVPTFGTVGAASYSCAPGGTSIFTDVSPGDSFCKHVHYLAAQNVTLGCNPSQYCPGQIITRDAMASFVAKAIVAPGGGSAVPLAYGPDSVTGLSYSCAAGSPNLHFTDVPTSNAFCKHIHYLWAKGIVSGCTATKYCPSLPVRRDEMAKFLVNGFGLQLYGP